MGQLRKMQRSLLPTNELKWPINDPRQWHKYGETPSFDVAGFQRKINDLVGMTAHGKPIVRLVDAQKVLRWEAGDMRLRYRYFHTLVDTPEGKKWYDAAPPRFVLEERIEPAQYMPGWEEARYVKDGAGLQIDILGDPPVDGMYRPFWDVVDHKHNCCARFPKLKCWGIFRQPGARELEMLSSVMQAINKDEAYQSPHEPLTPRTLAQIALESQSYTAAEDSALHNQWREFWLNEYSIWGYRAFTDDPSVLSHGRFHFVQQPSGIYSPQGH